MALENAETPSDQLALSESEEPVPGSSPLRVSTNTLLESGIPPARQREEADGQPVSDLGSTLDSGIERMETALANQVRTEANLGLLARGLKHLSASAQAAREANSELMNELDELRTHLTRSHQEEQATRFRMSQLEQLLDVIRHETARERAFLIEQQDLFLVEILTDHERQIGDLHDRLREASQNKIDTDLVRELSAQRDQAREYATRCERERDLAWQELADAAAPTPPANPDRVQRSPSAATAIGSVSLRTLSVPASGAAPDTERLSERSSTGYSLSGEDVSD
ncbi:MAG TPA: hypothetical protein VGC79_10970 [Polyangiaceae bacterium]